MGVTSQSIKTIESVLEFAPEIKTVIDLGAQNDYRDEIVRTNPGKYPYISEWWRAKGIQYNSIDLSGENESFKIDLAKPINNTNFYDLVCDFGTSEHVKDYFEVNRNIHDLCKVGGFMIREVPALDNWPGHGLHYVDELFFEALTKENNYEIVQLKREAAMGNTTDGWNIVCVMKKMVNGAFSNRFPVFTSFDDHMYERSQEWIYNPR